MLGHNGHCLGKVQNCLGKVQTGMSVEGCMHYDHKGNENKSNKSAGVALGSTHTWNSMESAALMATFRLSRPDLRNLGIRRNRIWAKVDKVDGKFSMIKDRLTLRRTFSKYRIVIPTREKWGKNWPNQLREGHVWFTDGACNQ